MRAGSAIVVAGGKGLRMGYHTPKQFIDVKGKPLLAYTLESFLNHPYIQEVVLVLPQDHIYFWQALLAEKKLHYAVTIATGGETRADSVFSGLRQLQNQEGLVAIQDAVRPFSGHDLISRCMEAADSYGCGIAAVPVKDSLRIMFEGQWKHLNRGYIRAMQTPQCFDTARLLKAYESAVDLENFTDDAGVFEAAGYPIHLVDGHYENIKITTPEDLLLAESLVNQTK